MLCGLRFGVKSFFKVKLISTECENIVSFNNAGRKLSNDDQGFH